MQAAQREQRYETGAVLYMAMELSNRQWKLGFSAGGEALGQSIPLRPCCGQARLPPRPSGRRRRCVRQPC